MKWRWVIAPVAMSLALFAFGSTASASTVFHPRVKNALGLIPPVNSQGQFGAQDVATGALTPVTYHGGSVMTGGVTVHTIFWTGGTNPFQGSPGAGIPTYEGMVQQFFTDVAAAHTGSSGGPCTTAECNVFTVEPQFGQETGVDNGTTPPGTVAGDNTISYNLATDSINDTQPYPTKDKQCASADNAAVCITDAQLQQEVDRVINATGGSRGLHNLWYVFLPPGVDECITPGVCGTNAFGGYHSVSDLGSGPTIYALTIDPIIEAGSIAVGGDPEGNPDAEVTVDIAAHETNEAMTDPEGVGWMDPNGFEIGDKCEFGPQRGSPLGFAGPDHAPFNQVINGDQYLIQEMWANQDNNGQPDCVQATTTTTNSLPLPQVDLTQFSSKVGGNIGSATAGVGVEVQLVRAGEIVADQSTTTNGSGQWSLTLQRPVGDDRDEIDVTYSGTGAPTPNDQVILTGNGGNAFSESGWTGWFDLDTGSLLDSTPEISLGPCFQTGVETTSVTTEPPTDFCNTQTDVATEPLTAPAGPGAAVTYSTNDNRAFAPPDAPVPNGAGGLVSLTVPVGETDSVSALGSPLPFFSPGGFPSCTADLEAQTVACTGLVPGARYSVNGHHGTADGGGTVSLSMPVHRGDALALSNGSRTLTTLHVANLRVDITAEQPVLSGGSCQPDQYYGAPVTSPPVNGAAGEPGIADSGAICPDNGDATGLDASFIGQTDEASGGLTQTEVPDVEDTSPMQGEIVYGAFTALAESGLPGPGNTIIPTDSISKIAVSIAPAAGGAPVFTSGNVDTASGVPVNALSPRTYKATWTLTDANGDIRTVTTRFIEEPGLQGPQGPPGPRGPAGPRGPKPKVRCKLTHHGKKIKCSVTFPKAKKTKGKLQVRITRGGHVAALGTARVSRGKATVTLRELRRIIHGAWTITLVLSQPHNAASTTKMKLRMT